MTFSRRDVLRAAAASGLATGFPAVLRAQTKELLIGCPSSFASLLNKNFFQPFERKYGVKILFEGEPSTAHLEKLRANRAHPVYSLVLMDDPIMVVADREGLLSHLTPTTTPNIAKIPSNLVHEGGAFANYMLPEATIGYNTNLLPQGVASWGDLWRPQFKNQILMGAFPQLTQAVFPIIVAASLATGLSFDAALHSKEAIDAGFRKLAQIKPNALAISANTSQLWVLLEQGEASAFMACTIQILPSLQKAGAPVAAAQPKEGAFAMPNSISVVKNGPNEDLAFQLANEFFGYDYQSKMADVFGAAPALETARTPPGFARPANLYAADWPYIVDHTSQWAERWAHEIGG